jgi:hypothetical protein
MEVQAPEQDIESSWEGSELLIKYLWDLRRGSPSRWLVES